MSTLPSPLPLLAAYDHSQIAIDIANESDRLAAVRDLGLLDTPPEPDFDEAVRLAALICNTPVGLITVLDKDRQWFKARIGVEIDETPREYAFCNHAVGRTSALIVPDLRDDARFAANPFVTGDPNVRFYAGVPLRTSTGHTIGTLCVLDVVPRQLTAEQEGALSVLARQLATHIDLRGRARLLQTLINENRRMQEELHDTNERLRELSMTDSLTRLPNRRALEEALDQQIALNARTHTAFSVLVVDIDYFKSFNEYFGHSTCDEILRTVGRILSGSSRPIDLVARHGGEEFAILLPNCDRTNAAEIGERLRSAIAAHPWQHRPLTVSIGAATWDASMSTRQGFLEAADTALYFAKTVGRNRVFIFDRIASLLDNCA